MQQEMSTQPKTSPLTGLIVRLDRDIDRQSPCHGNFAIIHAGKGSHLGELRCKECNRHRGWIQKEMGAQLLAVIGKFGRPQAPLNIQKVFPPYRAGGDR